MEASKKNPALQVEKLKFQITNLRQDQITNEMISHAIHTLNSFKATGADTDRTLIFQTVDQFFDFCSTKPRRAMYPAFTSGIVLDCRKETKIKHLIKIRKIEMGIRDLPAEKKTWLQKLFGL